MSDVVKARENIAKLASLVTGANVTTADIALSESTPNTVNIMPPSGGHEPDHDTTTTLLVMDLGDSEVFERYLAEYGLDGPDTIARNSPVSSGEFQPEPASIVARPNGDHTLLDALAAMPEEVMADINREIQAKIRFMEAMNICLEKDGVEARLERYQLRFIGGNETFDDQIEINYIDQMDGDALAAVNKTYAFASAAHRVFAHLPGHEDLNIHAEVAHNTQNPNRVLTHADHGLFDALATLDVPELAQQMLKTEIRARHNLTTALNLVMEGEPPISLDQVAYFKNSWGGDGFHLNIEVPRETAAEVEEVMAELFSHIPDHVSGMPMGPSDGRMGSSIAGKGWSVSAVGEPGDHLLENLVAMDPEKVVARMQEQQQGQGEGQSSFASR